MTIPMIELASGHVYACENSNWVAVYQSGETVDVRSHPCASLMLLYHGLDELSNMAGQAFATANSAGEHIPLPVEDIIRAGLTAWGQGWPALALERAAEFAGIAALEPEISALAETGKTQAIRHRALKLRARIRRERGEQSGSPRPKSRG